MKFKVTGKGDTTVKQIKEALDVFADECMYSYRKQIKGSKVMKATEYIQKASPVPMAFKLPDEIFIFATVEGDCVIYETPSLVPVKFLEKKANKAMQKNLKGFLESKGLKVDVELLKDKQ